MLRRRYEFENGFDHPPKFYLNELSTQEDEDIQTFLMRENRRRFSSVSVSPVPSPKEMSQLGKALDAVSAAEFAIANPAFLDEFVEKHIAPDRVRAWLRVPADNSLSEESEPSRSSDDGSSPEDERPPPPRERRKSLAFTTLEIETSIRYRQIMSINRSFYRFPFKYQMMDYQSLIEQPDTNEPLADIDSHHFSSLMVANNEISKVFIKMSELLFGKKGFPMPELCCFLASLKANYLNNYYHNYHHALSHAQSMFFILKNNPGVFTELEMKALLIASISHSVGHIGLDERFMNLVHGALTTMYESPMVENLHLDITLRILLDMKCNVFSRLDGVDYTAVVRDIELEILSTSGDRYNRQMDTMRRILSSKYSLHHPDVKEAVKSLLMMACDMSDAWKPFWENSNLVLSLYKEYFSQGDMEQNFGIASPDKMKRENTERIPQYQIELMDSTCLPVFEMLAKVFPNTAEVLECAKENREEWRNFRMARTVNGP